MNILRKSWQAILISTVFYAAASLAADVYADPDSNSADAASSASTAEIAARTYQEKQVIHIGEDIDLNYAVKFIYKKPRIVVKALYPQLLSENEYESVNPFNDMIANVIDEEVKEYEQTVIDLRASKKDIPKKMTNTLFIDYSASYIKSKKNHILSIRFTMQGLAGGMKQPTHEVRVLNYVINTQEELALENLFLPGVDYLNILSEYAIDALSRKLGDAKMIAEGASPTTEHFKNWNLKSTGLVISFPAATVAPYAYGFQTITIPFSKLKTVMNPDSLLGFCVDNPRTCGRYNRLTGSFIDEAKRKTMIKHFA